MLKELRIENFKGWEDTTTIRMSPITLFFGANSSGKSSIGQFLMLLKQTVESQDRKSVLFPGTVNSAVQLGSFQEMVYGRDKTKEISFRYRWSLPEALGITDPITDEKFRAEEIDFEATVGVANEKEHSVSVGSFRYGLFEKENESMAVKMARRDSSKKKAEFKVESEDYNLVRQPGRVWNPGPPVRFYGFPEEVVAYHQNADFVQKLNLAQEKLFRSLSYLGPMRTKTTRLYTWSGIEPDSVGYGGENSVPAMLAAKERKISMGFSQRYLPFEQVIAQKLKDMGLIEKFEVKPISDNRQNYEVKVKTKGSVGYVDLPDVGFGISQVLPVLIQCFYAPHNSIILMEQPEIHLHPSAQSLLADVVIDAINAKEDGRDRNIQLIIETHSEHFLRRLQRRLAEKVIEKSQLSAYFADVSKQPAQLAELRVDEFGNISNWPENFFGDEMGDITEQSKAALRRRMEESE